MEIDKRGIVDMVLTVGWIEGKLDVVSEFTDGKTKQEILKAKGNLANLADDLIEIIERDE